MSNPSGPLPALPSLQEADPLNVYRDSFIDVPDPAEAIHNELVQTMPYLDGEARIKAAHYFDSAFVDAESVELASFMVQDDPYVQRRVLELYYGENELSNQEVMVRAITEAPHQGPDEATEYQATIVDLLDSEPGENFYQDDIVMVIGNVLGNVPARAAEPIPAAEYKPNILRLYKAIERPALVIGGAEIREPADLHKLNLPELRQPWEKPVDEVIDALATGSHVLVDSRRNSGKTHIFPGVLRDQAPATWQISEMTNNFLRGGEWMLGNTAEDFFKGILKGRDVDSLIAHEHSLTAPTPHTRRAASEVPERKILIVDEIQATIIDNAMREGKVLDKLVEWANSSGTQLILISALSDGRQKPKVQTYIKEILQQQYDVNIEASFARPEYPKGVLTQLLVHAGVSLEVIKWWTEEPVATPLRTMRGVFAMYHDLSDVRSYEHIEDYRLRTTHQLGQLMLRRNPHLGNRPLINGLATICAGSGPQMVALADYFGVPAPNYTHLGFGEDVTPEDVL